MTTDLERASKISRIAAISTVASSSIVIGALLFGYVQTTRATREVHQLTVTRAGLQDEIGKLSAQKELLQKQREKLKQEINTYIASDPNAAATKRSPAPTIAGQPIKIYIYIAETRDMAEAQKAERLFRERGYTVEALKVQPVSNSPHETTVRFFQYDRSTVATGRELVKMLQGVGFRVRTEFDDEYVGAAKSPPPGTFDFWIGTLPSYNPKGG